MLVVMDTNAGAGDLESLVVWLREHELEGYKIPGAVPALVIVPDPVAGSAAAAALSEASSRPGVARVERHTGGARLASRAPGQEITRIEFGHSTDTALTIGGACGERGLVIMAGPCAVESEETTREVAFAVKAAGATVLRGGAYKPRTSPYSFQGLERDGLRILRKVADEVGLAVITECMDAEHVEIVEEHTDIVQVGARNMQNFTLLRRLGRCSRPVMLKRGFGSTANELLMAAEHIMVAGNQRVILCERGVKGFGDHARAMLDLAIVPHLREVTHLPVVVDPSHGTGRRRLIPAMARAAAATAPDAIMLEVHPAPERALSDGHQALSLQEFAALTGVLRAIHQLAAGGTPVPFDLQAV